MPKHAIYTTIPLHRTKTDFKKTSSPKCDHNNKKDNLTEQTKLSGKRRTQAQPITDQNIVFKVRSILFSAVLADKYSCH